MSKLESGQTSEDTKSPAITTPRTIDRGDFFRISAAAALTALFGDKVSGCVTDTKTDEAIPDRQETLEDEGLDKTPIIGTELDSKAARNEAEHRRQWAETQKFRLEHELIEISRQQEKAMQSLIAKIQGLKAAGLEIGEYHITNAGQIINTEDTEGYTMKREGRKDYKAYSANIPQITFDVMSDGTKVGTFFCTPKFYGSFKYAVHERGGMEWCQQSLSFEPRNLPVNILEFEYSFELDDEKVSIGREGSIDNIDSAADLVQSSLEISQAAKALVTELNKVQASELFGVFRFPNKVTLGAKRLAPNMGDHKPWFDKLVIDADIFEPDWITGEVLVNTDGTYDMSWRIIDTNVENELTESGLRASPFDARPNLANESRQGLTAPEVVQTLRGIQRPTDLDSGN